MTRTCSASGGARRTAYLIAFLGRRARAAGLNGSGGVEIPITQLHVADTLGMSLVHTNKTIRKLMERRLILWRDRGCEILDIDGLMSLARWEGLPENLRPLI